MPLPCCCFTKTEMTPRLSCLLMKAPALARDNARQQTDVATHAGWWVAGRLLHLAHGAAPRKVPAGQRLSGQPSRWHPWGRVQNGCLFVLAGIWVALFPVRSGLQASGRKNRYRGGLLTASRVPRMQSPQNLCSQLKRDMPQAHGPAKHTLHTSSSSSSAGSGSGSGSCPQRFACSFCLQRWWRS